MAGTCLDFGCSRSASEDRMDIASGPNGEKILPKRQTILSLRYYRSVSRSIQRRLAPGAASGDTASSAS
jgi:hypothetical protein